MTPIELQQRLAAKGFDPGPIDGQVGARTYGALFAFVGGKASPDTDALGRGAAAQFPRYGIDCNPLRLAHFLAQGAVETGGFRRFEENLNYSADRLTAVWPRRFPAHPVAGQLVREQFAKNPEALANATYGGRGGNTHPGDGWRYRGRGLTMLTFLDNYAEAEELTGLPLLADPDLARDPEVSVAIMGGYWARRNINVKADADDLTGVRKTINGGVIGLEEARAYLRRAKEVLR